MTDTFRHQDWHPEIPGSGPDILPFYESFLPGKKRFCEVGVAAGRSILFAASFFRARSDLRLCAVDRNLSPFYDSAERLALEDRLPIETYELDGAAAAMPLRHHDFDAVFFDACHDEECLMAQILAWAARLRRGAWLAGHDYDESKNAAHPGVASAVKKTLGYHKINVSWTCWAVQL